MDREAHLRKKFANAKSQRVKTDESLTPALEDETVEHLLAEPKNENVSVDGVLYFGEQNAGKCLGIEDFSCEFEYGLNPYRGGLHSSTAREEEDDFALGVLDGLLDEVDEVEDLHATDGLASPCEDFLLDIDFAGKVSVLAPGLCQGSHSRNPSSESQSPGLSGSSNSAIGISDSSTVTVQDFEYKNDSLNKTEKHGLQAAVRRKKRCRTPLQGTCLDSQDFKEFDDDENPLLSDLLLSNQKGKSSIEACKVGSFLREKRLRKPTQRYIEEFSNKKSKYLKGRGKFSSGDAVTANDKGLKMRSHGDLHNVRPKTLSAVSEEELLSGTKIQEVPLVRGKRGRPKKHVSVPQIEPDEEHFTSESEDDSVTKRRCKSHDRRKHQRMWTLTEVMNLVDGISEYGVGRWTDIKRLLFAASAYRTPIDLRDKWRNLLRASCAHKLKKKEMEERQGHAVRPLPKSLLRRVRELAKIHPYPRERGVKSIGEDDPSTLPTSSKGAPLSVGRKNNVRRKNCT
ncbi:uncharacterized protein LOC107407763 isoform X1 [Ziziphus jujuba]|nr:uncharacterized protein LOC107407763 isoform X1 [Ziziphus jujuba]